MTGRPGRQDATYIEIPDKHVVFSRPETLFPGRLAAAGADPDDADALARAREALVAGRQHSAEHSAGVQMVRGLQDADVTMDQVRDRPRAVCVCVCARARERVCVPPAL